MHQSFPLILIYKQPLVNSSGSKYQIFNLRLPPLTRDHRDSNVSPQLIVFALSGNFCTFIWWKYVVYISASALHWLNMYNNQNNNIHKYRGNVRILTLSTNKYSSTPLRNLSRTAWLLIRTYPKGCHFSLSGSKLSRTKYFKLYSYSVCVFTESAESQQRRRPVWRRPRFTKYINEKKVVLEQWNKWGFLSSGLGQWLWEAARRIFFYA